MSVATSSGEDSGGMTIGDFARSMPEDKWVPVPGHPDYEALKPSDQPMSHPFRNDGAGCCITCEDPPGVGAHAATSPSTAYANPWGE